MRISFLELIGHSIFVQDWDFILKNNWHKIRTDGYEKVVISQRTSFFTKNKLNEYELHEVGYPDTESLQMSLLNNLIYPDPISDQHINESLIKSSKRVDWTNLEYQEHFFASGHMIFSSMSFLYDVLPDPRVIFFGEEHTIPLRAYTNGYRIFAIKENILFTLNKTPDYLCKIEKKDWKNYQTPNNFCTPHVFYQNFFHKILKGEELGSFGAKDQESYLQYIKAMGVDYRNMI
jgi:hypothetical protein